MSNAGKEHDDGNKSLTTKPRSLEIAEKGIRTGQDFAGLMSNLMSDLIAGRVSAQTANAVCNAGGKLLKVVEMRHKYGRQASEELNSLVLTE